MRTLLTISLMLTLVIQYGIVFANTVEENRLALERDVQSQLKDHALCKHIGLKDDNTWLSIELTEETWDKPKDTKNLVDKVKSAIKKHLPLSLGAVPFKVFVHEPTSGYGVAEVSIVESQVSLSYMYPDFQPWARGKITYVRSQQSSDKKAATLTEIRDTSVANTPEENRLALEMDVQSELKDHYLYHDIGLKEENAWLSIELKTKTWFNPVDTRALANSVVTVVRRHLPLSLGASLFKVYIDEPTSGYGVAEVSIAQSEVSMVYMYLENASYALKEIQNKPKVLTELENKRARQAYVNKVKGLSTYNTETTVGSSHDAKPSAPKALSELENKRARQAYVNKVKGLSTYNKETTAAQNSNGNATAVSSDDAILSVPTTGGVLIAVDKSAFAEFNRAATSGDYDLLSRLIETGRLTETSNNIKIRVLEWGILKHKVKILEGKNTGSVGWIATEFVKKK